MADPSTSSGGGKGTTPSSKTIGSVRSPSKLWRSSGGELRSFATEGITWRLNARSLGRTSSTAIRIARWPGADAPFWACWRCSRPRRSGAAIASVNDLARVLNLCTAGSPPEARVVSGSTTWRAIEIGRGRPPTTGQLGRPAERPSGRRHESHFCPVGHRTRTPWHAVGRVTPIASQEPTLR